MIEVAIYHNCSHTQLHTIAQNAGGLAGRIRRRLENMRCSKCLDSFILSRKLKKAVK